MSNRKSPFKANKELAKSISAFLQSHGATFSQEAKRTSAYFEIAAYNDLVKFYENSGYTVNAANLRPRKKVFAYAMSPNVKPENVSYFIATRKYKDGTVWSFEIRHNIRIQSQHDPDVFVTPDYAIIDKESIQSIRLSYHYNGKTDYFFVAAESVRTFAETKHYNPSPEMVLNFVGLVNEIIPGCLTGTCPTHPPKHFAPALFVSGLGSIHVRKIRDSLRNRYGINIFLGLFAYPTQVYSKNNQTYVNKVGTW